MSKKFFEIPSFLFFAYIGTVSWDKLVGHYLNFTDGDSSHNNQIDFEQRYQLKNPNGQSQTAEEDEFTMRQLSASKNFVFKNQSKDRKAANVLSKIRNLENIIYVDENELKACQSIEELQLLIDSAVPKDGPKSTDQLVQDLHKNIEKYKLLIENKKYFRSEKERFLGLPFMLKRHMQFPEPEVGTWQWNLFEDLFSHDYYAYKGQVENEEKINKFNYENFLHPSVINKFDNGKSIIT